MSGSRDGHPQWSLLQEAVPTWAGEGPEGDVVVSSRVRLARNFAGFPFVNRADRDRRELIVSLARNLLMPMVPGGWFDLTGLSPVQRAFLVERHLISQQHSRGKQLGGGGGHDEPRGVAIGLPDQSLAVMVNEEDHLRMQRLRPGLDLGSAAEQLGAIDDQIEANVGYAFSPRFGYLTACPTNVGTGVRFSVMLHLAGLRMIGSIDKVKRAAADMSLAVRGFQGENTEAAGDLYQVSNQTTLGKTEAVLLHELAREIIPKILEYERGARQLLLSRRRAVLEDHVFRAIGVLSTARLLTTEEAMAQLSAVRLGAAVGLVRHVDPSAVTRLMLAVQPAHLQVSAGREIDQDARKLARAELVRRSAVAMKLG